MVEATMWVTAINDQLEVFYGDSYKTERDKSRYGPVVLGVRWARNRHLHQLPVTLDEDQTPFFGGGKGVISLSAGMRWRKVKDLPPADPNHLHKTAEAAYRSHLQGRNSGKTLAACDLWFAELEKSPTCLL